MYGVNEKGTIEDAVLCIVMEGIGGAWRGRHTGWVWSEWIRFLLFRVMGDDDCKFDLTQPFPTFEDPPPNNGGCKKINK